jgi:uncharacterized membrane protein
MDGSCAEEAGMDWIVLIGVAVIVVGFLLKLDVIAVVVVAALATSIASGDSFGDFLKLLGKSFVDNRAVSLFLLTLPMIALSERYGLKEQAITLIKRFHQLTVGRFLTLYLVIRQLTGIFGIRISGMVQFVRPIVYPMAAGAARGRGATSTQAEEKVKAESALSENIGNFFGQNGFVAASGVLLIVGTLKDAGLNVSPERIAAASVPMIVIASIVTAVHFALMDRKLAKGASAESPESPQPAEVIDGE